MGVQPNLLPIAARIQSYPEFKKESRSLPVKAPFVVTLQSILRHLPLPLLYRSYESRIIGKETSCAPCLYTCEKYLDCFCLLIMCPLGSRNYFSLVSFLCALFTKIYLTCVSCLCVPCCPIDIPHMSLVSVSPAVPQI
jgi:hypothetical protein